MKARSLRALLLASSLILSVGTAAMPIMAVDIAPDTSDSGISIDADDGGNDGSAVTPDTSGDISPDTTQGGGTDIAPDNGTNINPDNNTIVPDDGQHTVTPTPLPGTSVTPTPANGEVPQVTWDVKYDDNGYLHVKPSVVERGNIVYAVSIDNNWDFYYTTVASNKPGATSEVVKKYYTMDTSTWTAIPTIPSDQEALFKGDISGSNESESTVKPNVPVCPDDDNCYRVDINYSKNFNLSGVHHVTFYVYYWFKDTQKGSEIYKFDFDTEFISNEVTEDSQNPDDLVVIAKPVELTSLKAVYSLSISSVNKLSSYSVSLADGSDSGLYTHSDDCEGLTSYNTTYTFLQNGTYAISVTDEEGHINYQEVTVSNITGEDDGTNKVDTLPTTNSTAPTLSVSGVPSAKSVQLGNTVNIVVSSNMNCTITGDGIENPVKGTSVTVPIDTNGVYEFYGTLDDGTYGRTSVTIDCFADESSGSNQAQSTVSSKTYSSLEDFWGSQLDDKLPQTGTIGLSSVLGLGIAGMASGLVLMKRKRNNLNNAEKEDEDNEK